MGMNWNKASAPKVATPGPPKLTEQPEDIEELNDSVHQLYTPEGGHQAVDVVFFHGLPPSEDYKKAFWQTWLSRDGSVVWPKDWLSRKLPKARIVSISYDSYAREHDGALDPHKITENLINDIILDDPRVGQDCPMVLVGHSLGGIIIKEFLLECLNKRGELLKNNAAQPEVELINKFLENCKGVFYYSTPHAGSRISEYFEKTPGIQLNEPLMKLLTILNSKTGRINAEFANARVGEGISTFAIAESKDTTYMGFKGKIVDEASARHDIDALRYYTAPEVNHFDVCKAKNDVSCGIFKILLKFINTAIEDKRPGLRGKVLPAVREHKPVSTGNNSNYRASTSEFPKFARSDGLPGVKEQPAEIKERPKDIKKLNDSIYQLYRPQGEPEVVVLFFHGLPELSDDYREAFWKSWLSRDGKVVWPKDWLPKHLPRVQILTVSYDACPPKHDGAPDDYIIAENLMQDVILNYMSLGQNCPVVLVGHSLGGIIIKEFLSACWQRRGLQANHARARPQVDLIEKFLGNCKGVFYYSTPHLGSRIADLLNQKRGVHLNDPLIELLKTLSAKTSRINSVFASTRGGEGISTRAIGEGKDTTYMDITARVVEDASARLDIDPMFFYTATDANHFEVCKARNNEDCKIYRMLLDFINSVQEDNRPEEVRMMTVGAAENRRRAAEQRRR